MPPPQSGRAAAGWRKSSYTEKGLNTCVLVKRTNRCWLTDSAARHAPVLRLPYREWVALLHALRTGRL